MDALCQRTLMVPRVFRASAVKLAPPWEHHETRPASPARGGSAEMISDLLTTNADVPLQRTRRELRLKMRPSTAARGALDGGWWPWSTDPAAEFPALVMALSSWVGPARHLAYHPDDWDPAESTLTVEGWTVHMAALPTIQPNTVVLTGPNLKQICMLVVPPATPGGVARAVLRSASGSDTTATVADILASNGVSLGGQPSTAQRV